MDRDKSYASYLRLRNDLFVQAKVTLECHYISKGVHIYHSLSARVRVEDSVRARVMVRVRVRTQG